MNGQLKDQETLHDRAVESLKRESDFHAHLLAYILVNGFLIVIWSITGVGFFWPAIPMVGWGIGLAFHAWDTYVGRPPSEPRIQREMQRLSRDDR